MASYFIKYRIRYYTESKYQEDSTIVDFEKFEKVERQSIYTKLKESIGHSYVDLLIDNIVKL